LVSESIGLVNMPLLHFEIQFFVSGLLIALLLQLS
jgi:hypothetical protein